MKNNTLLGLTVGFVAGAAAAIAGAIAINKVSAEIKADLNEYSFMSPDCNNTVVVSRGASKTAKGLTLIKVKAIAEGKDDVCKLSMLAGKDAEILSGEWTDNDHFELVVGKGKRLQYCDVNFCEDDIKMLYYFKKITLDVPEEIVVDELKVDEIEAPEVTEKSDIEIEE